MSVKDKALAMAKYGTSDDIASWVAVNDVDADELRRAIDGLVAREVAAAHEACARLIEALPPGFGDLNRNDVAARIRNRSNA